MSIIVQHVEKSFGEPPTSVLHDVSFEVAAGEFVSLTGKSGSGKSTLLYIISTLDHPTSGSVEIEGQLVNKMSERDVHRFRNENVGFVFQFHYLLPELSALENVLLPARKAGQQEQLRPRALGLMEGFGLDKLTGRLPGQLSGGEQQRVSVARALLMEPRYIFADEPTGNLDSKSGSIVMDIFRRINRERGTTIVMVTHDRDFARTAHRQIVLKDGRMQ
jgi:putative ABC transport system ATP-binding protein/lipoprotein-releasing system ATP-binding protein